MKLILIALFLALSSATAAQALMPTPIIVDGPPSPPPPQFR